MRGFNNNSPGVHARAARIMGMVVMAVALLGAPMARPAVAQVTELPDVDVVLVVEVRDAVSWMALQQSVLATPRDGSKSLLLSVAAGTGGERSLAIRQPRFDVALTRGNPAIVVQVTGKVSGADALRGLTPFTHAVSDAHQRGGENAILLTYGLYDVIAILVELRTGRP
jgi:hypothetical protein